MPEKPPGIRGKPRKLQLSPRAVPSTDNAKMEWRRLDPMRGAVGIEGYSPAEAVAKFFPGRNDVTFEILVPPKGMRAGEFAVWGKTEPRGTLFKPVIDLLGIRASPADGERKAVVATETYDLEAATIVDHVTGQHWYDVRLIPVIDAPNAAYFLDGRPFAEAFDMFVLGNPEVDPAVSEAARLCPRLGERIGRRKFLGDTSRLPLPIRAPVFPMRFATDSTEPDTSTETRAVVGRLESLLFDKISRLLDLLAAGRILADGINPDTRQRIEVDAQAWNRRGFAVDVLAGDVIDTTVDRIEWRDVVLRAPKPVEAVVVAGETADGALKPIGAGGKKEDHAYLAALDQLIAGGFHETEATSGENLSQRMRGAFAEAGFVAPRDDGTIQRWLRKNMPTLWSKATGRR